MAHTLLIQPLFIGSTELILIVLLALLLFGGKKLPELMRGLGRGVQEFRKGASEITNPSEQKEEKKDKEN